LLRAPAALVLVDGYNVAKLGWPEVELAIQRERCLDLVDDIARRFSSEVAVVFDGAEVVGSHATRRRLARVAYSRPGESADDVIRTEVKAAPLERPVVVVTNDRAIRRDVAADGANIISSDSFLAVAR
jgi:predicted RNA-binding protein with PIN domain